MNDKRSSIIGFALIGIILLLYTWYSNTQREKLMQAEEQRVRDSIASIAPAQAEAADSTVLTVEATEAAQDVEAPDQQAYPEGWLAQASQAQTEYYTLENDKVRIRITSKGAQPYDVLIKDYFAYDSTELLLVRPGKSQFGFELNTNQWLKTEDLNFSPVDATDSTLTLRLQFARGGPLRRGGLGREDARRSGGQPVPDR